MPLRAKYDLQGALIEIVGSASPMPTSSLTWDMFRSLFTESELMLLDAADDGNSQYLSDNGITLNASQRAQVYSVIQKGKSRGAERSITTTTSGMAAALNILENRGFIVAGRAAEIISGIQKS